MKTSTTSLSETLTILTDDEIDALDDGMCGMREFHQTFARAIEAAVLAKLREQESVAWMVKDTDGRTFIFRETEPSVSAGETLSPLYAAPLPAVVQVPPLMSCRCFDDVSRRFCKDKNRCSRVEAQAAPEAPAQAIPAPWREAVKVAREALQCSLAYGLQSCDDWVRDKAEAALAQLDSLEGGE